MSETREKPSWLDRKDSIDLLYRGLWLLCVALALADFFYHKHVTVEIEGVPAVYGIYGFLCFFGIVMVGKYLRKLVGRKEDYYDR